MGNKVLIVGDSSTIHTGFGRVVKEIATGLYNTGKYEIKTIGWFYWSGENNNEVVPYPVIPTKRVNEDIYSQITFQEVVSEFQPDVVIAVGDCWMIAHIGHCRDRNKFKLIYYVPVDGAPYKQEWAKELNLADEVVAYGKFGAGQMNLAGVDIKKTSMIPHGVNAEDFYPIKDKDSLKKKFNSAGKFVVGMVGRNQPRKMIPRLLKAFKIFIGDFSTCQDCGNIIPSVVEKCDACDSANIFSTPRKEDTILYMHTSLKDYGWDISELISRYGLVGKVILPKNVGVGAGVSTELLNEIMNVFDIFTLPTSGEGWCFSPGTMVKKDIGFEKIENIKTGDMVVSHTGKLCKVISPLQREYQGEMIILNPRCGKEIESTPNHPWLIVKRMNGGFGKTRRHLLQYKDIEPEWISAENISKGDLLVIPKISKLERVAIKSIKISDVLGIESINGWVHTNGYAKCEIGLLEISKKFGISFQSVSRMIRGERNSKLAARVREYAKSVGYKTEKRKYKDEIEITPELLFSFGHYIAEGSGKDRISFGMNKDDTYAKNIQELVFEKVFGLKIKTKKPILNKMEIYCTSSLLASFYKKLFGDGAHNKQIPDIFKNKEHAPHILRGYFYGDGSFVKSDRFSFSSVSEKLCYDIKECLMLLDIPSNFILDNRGCYNLNVSKQYGERFIEKINPIKYKEPCRIENISFKNTSFLEDNDNFYAIIRDVKRSAINDTVYNLSVEEDNSYVVEDYAVHNCLPIHEGMACGLPCVVTNYSAHVDFCEGVSELIEVSEYITEVGTNLERAVVDIYDYVMRLDKLYYDDSEVFKKKWGAYIKSISGKDEVGITGSEARRILGNAAHKRSLEYQWKNIIPQWENLIDVYVSGESKKNISFEVV